MPTGTYIYNWLDYYDFIYSRLCLFIWFSRMIDRIESWRQMSLLAMNTSSSTTTPDEEVVQSKGWSHWCVYDTISIIII